MHRIRSIAEGPRVVAIMASRGREDRFLDRSIGSVVAQSRLPDVLVVVLDIDDETHAERIRASTIDMVAGRFPVVFLRNERSKGPSGAWNTGLDWAHREWSNPEAIYVAAIDDDDAWESGHVEACLTKAVESDLDMVAADLLRVEQEGDLGKRLSAPPTLCVQTLLAKGQHIQGSNLFVRLSRLLEAGLFDEQLPSCTDRDLVARLALLDRFRYASLQRCTVRHYADPRPDRCSTPGSDAKVRGLTGFCAKWAGAMTEETRGQFEARGRSLFQWSMQEVGEPPVPEFHHGISKFPEAAVSLVVGIIVDPARPQLVDPLLAQLAGLGVNPRIAGLEVLLLENGAAKTDRLALSQLVQRWQSKGLRCFLLTKEQQESDDRAGHFGPSFECGTARAPIAIARTRISVYAARHALLRPGAWVWLLDDDVRLCGPQADGSEFVSPDIDRLLALASGGVRVVYGPVVGAPPLPFLACLRTQAVDALQFLIECEFRSGPVDLGKAQSRALALRQQARDYYYDNSRRDTGLLETPFPIAASLDTGDRAELARRLAAQLPRALAGEQVTRPLCLMSNDDVPNSLRRGPSALWFHPEDLLLAPNSMARIDGAATRRSDMLVALISRDVFGLRSVESPAIAVSQDRSDLDPAPDAAKLKDDIFGYALYSAVEDVLKAPCAKLAPSQLGCLCLSDEQLDLAIDKFRKYLDERCFALSLSAWRLRGVASSARAWLERNRGQVSEEMLAPAERIVASLASFSEALAPEIAEQIRSSGVELSDATLRASFAALASNIEQFRHGAAGGLDIRGALQEQRIAMAHGAVERAFGVSSLRYLGAGTEGVVLADDVHVYKVIDYWKARDFHRAVSFLRDRAGRPTSSVALPPIEAFVFTAGTAVLMTPYCETQPYIGDCGPGLVRLLRDARRLGLVCRNVHPKNLRVRGEDVVLVDYGADLREFDASEFLSMAKRCWLSWRWSHRADLSVLMRRSLTEEHLPELQGFDRFLATLDVPGLGQVLDPLLLELAGEVRGRGVLDFGCGKGRLAIKLASLGAEVVGYDPNPVAVWPSTQAATMGSPSFTAELAEAMTRGPFDAVIASLVLCEIREESEYRQALLDLRSAVKADGRVIIAVCNPFHTFGGSTPLHSARRVPNDVTYDDVFVLEECVAGCGEPRADVHRPLHRLRRDLLRAGLRIESVHQTEAVDLDRFEPASDFLVLVARPVKRRNAPCSLIVKACPQEWETVDAQVRHIVDTLTDPLAFEEHVLAVDSRRAGYPRAYGAGDVASFERAVNGLVRAGYIDRVVQAPEDPELRRSCNQRWFALDSDAARAVNGQATLAFLAALESCSTPLALQLDLDLMLCRAGPGHDWFAQIESVFAKDPRAVSVSLGIAATVSRDYEPGPWRIESRGCVVHLGRLLGLRPLSNALEGEMLALPWHRALDRHVASGVASSYRGADPRFFFVHPQNQTKEPRAEWMLALDGISRGRMPADQVGRVDWVGNWKQNLPRERCERFVFVLTGRNVPPGRMRRCLDSIVSQRQEDWGAVIVDDGSSALSAEFLELWCAGHSDKVTLLRPRLRRGQLANLNDAIRSVCTNPESVIITVDLDDELIGAEVLDLLAARYAEGADATVGSMLRTDKHRIYEVSFDAPRLRRGGNVWQHLRTFRKHLFDALSEDDLKVGDRFVELATDWAFMLPIIERARHPVWIRQPLYLYEPSGVGKGADRSVREREIADLCARHSHAPAAIESGAKQ